MFGRALLAILVLATTPLIAQTTVPFVGCPSDGQIGPLEAPKDLPKAVSLPPETGARLAYYRAEEGVGVLAPLGWHCFSTYGSNGSSLFVSPQPLSSNNFFHDEAQLFKGPFIQVSISIGDTSGRFDVAVIIARLFPSHRQFALNVLHEHLLLNELPRGPFAKDHLRYLSKESVEYTTPANQVGEGTQSFLAADDQPINGVVMLTGKELSAVHLAVRLAPQDSSLATYIMRQLEQDAAKLQ
jgi:hypothetical protein